MRVALLVAVLLGVLAAPAAAQSPYVIKFKPGEYDAITEGGASISSGECQTITVAERGGWDDGPFLEMPCGLPHISFDAPQAMVEFFVRVDAGRSITFSACRNSEDCSLTQTVTGTGGWHPVVLADPEGAATIVSVLDDGMAPSDIDDVAFSTVRQPDTFITPGKGPAEFSFSSTAENASYMCAVDKGEFTPCKSTTSFAHLAPGTHSLAVFAVDIYGAADNRSPAQADFVVAPSPPPPPPNRDRDGDGVPDATDNCVDVANSDQADGDADGVGNACDTLPPGNVPPKPGETSVVQVIAGEVFVKLPTRRPLGFSGLHAPFQDSGFQPLKGAASIPLGAEVDTRKGTVKVQSAANSFAATDRRAKQQSAEIKAAIFRMKQSRSKAKSASISTDVSLLTPAGSESRCVGAPAKGTVVRSISMVAKGFYRTIGGASTATARSATFNTSDRCDGTLTQVGRGTVTLTVKAASSSTKKKAKPVRVRAGQAYLVKAKLFAVRKGAKPLRGANG
jgi:hypothetical protein